MSLGRAIATVGSFTLLSRIVGFVRDIVPAIADGRIVPVVDRVFAFDELPVAKAHMEASAMVGKIVVRVP